MKFSKIYSLFCFSLGSLPIVEAQSSQLQAPPYVESDAGLRIVNSERFRKDFVGQVVEQVMKNKSRLQLIETRGDPSGEQRWFFKAEDGRQLTADVTGKEGNQPGFVVTLRRPGEDPEKYFVKALSGPYTFPGHEDGFAHHTHMDPHELLAYKVLSYCGLGPVHFFTHSDFPHMVVLSTKDCMLPGYETLPFEHNLSYVWKSPFDVNWKEVKDFQEYRSFIDAPRLAELSSLIKILDLWDVHGGNIFVAIPRSVCNELDGVRRKITNLRKELRTKRREVRENPALNELQMEKLISTIQNEYESKLKEAVSPSLSKIYHSAVYQIVDFLVNSQHQYEIDHIDTRAFGAWPIHWHLRGMFGEDEREAQVTRRLADPEFWNETRGSMLHGKTSFLAEAFQTVQEALVGAGFSEGEVAQKMQAVQTYSHDCRQRAKDLLNQTDRQIKEKRDQLIAKDIEES